MRYPPQMLRRNLLRKGGRRPQAGCRCVRLGAPEFDAQSPSPFENSARFERLGPEPHLQPQFLDPVRYFLPARDAEIDQRLANDAADPKAWVERRIEILE